MRLSELIVELKKKEKDGHGDLKVYYDFGAVEVGIVKVDEKYTVDGEHMEYIHLDWC